MDRNIIRQNFKKFLKEFDWEYVSEITQTFVFRNKYKFKELESKTDKKLFESTENLLDILFAMEDKYGKCLYKIHGQYIELEYYENNHVELRFIPEYSCSL